MKKALFFSFLISALVFTGCCKKCDLEFEQSELDHLRYELTGTTTQTFQNGSSAEVIVRFDGTSIEESGKTCGGFGSPDEDFCSTNSTQSFSVGSGLDDLEVILVKSNDDTSGGALQMEINMGMANIYVLFDDNLISQGTIDRTESLVINGTTYDDVLTYFFDPNIDCKDPGGAFCINDNDIVGVDFSLSVGLLRFQVHKGLQEPNEVYTIVN